MMNHCRPLKLFFLKGLLGLSLCFLLPNLTTAKSFDRLMDTSIIESQDLLLLNPILEADSLKQENPPKKIRRASKAKYRTAGKINLSFQQTSTPTITGFEELETPMPSNLRPFIVNDDIVMLLKDDSFWLKSETIQSKNYIIRRDEPDGIKTPNQCM